MLISCSLLKISNQINRTSSTLVLRMELGAGDNMISTRSSIRKGDPLSLHRLLSLIPLSSVAPSRLVENAKRVIETESASQLETISTFGRDVGMGTVLPSSMSASVSQGNPTPQKLRFYIPTTSSWKPGSSPPQRSLSYSSSFSLTLSHGTANRRKLHDLYRDH
jgi:hypothetical protein